MVDRKYPGMFHSGCSVYMAARKGRAARTAARSKVQKIIQRHSPKKILRSAGDRIYDKVVSPTVFFCDRIEKNMSGLNRD